MRTGKEYVRRIWLRGSKDSGVVNVKLIGAFGEEQEGTVGIMVARILTPYGYGSPGPSRYADEPEYHNWPLHFTAKSYTDHGRLEITATGSGNFHVGAVSLMPADNFHGLRADTLALFSELDAPVYRWPGGNFVSGYNWRDGIGDPTAAHRGRIRPGRALNQTISAWTSSSFCRELKHQPYIAVNAGLGEAAAAVEERPICQRDGDTPGPPACRTGGNPQPYAVSSGASAMKCTSDWQLGNMPLEKYEAETQPASSPPCGPPIPRSRSWPSASPGRGTRACSGIAPQMNLISEHFYCVGTKGSGPATCGRSPTTSAAIATHIAAIAGNQVARRAKTSASPWTSGTTGIGRTSMARSERATASGTPWGSPPG